MDLIRRFYVSWVVVAGTVSAIGCGELVQAETGAGDGTGSASATGGTATMGGTADSGTTAGSGTAESGSEGEPLEVCGDGITEGDEECDLAELNGTGMFCRDDCLANTCPDGYVGPGEVCDDGNDNNRDDCTNECGPTSCGDGVVQMRNGEQCDEGEANAATAACLPSCVAASCGDGNIWAGMEACDGPDVAGATCVSEGFDGGTLLCNADCASLDTSNCFVCGNSVVEPNEDCDGADLDAQSCASQGFDDGMLTCAGDCSFDTSGCTECGNGAQEPGEDCDMNAYPANMDECSDYGLDAGTLACNADCTVDTSGCTECGNGVNELGEECDGNDIPGGQDECSDFGLPFGVVICSNACTVDASACHACGNGSVDDAEQCDDPDLDGETCSSLGFDQGDLGCSGDCSFDQGDCCMEVLSACGGAMQCCNNLSCEGGACCIDMGGSCPNGPTGDARCCSGNCQAGSCT